MTDRLIFLRNLLTKARHSYYNAEAIMSDSEYDVYEDELRQLNPDDPILQEVGAVSSGIWPKHTHTIPMGSLSKFKGEEGLAEWWKKTESAL